MTSLVLSLPEVQVALYALWTAGGPTLRQVLALRDCDPGLRALPRQDLLRRVRAAGAAELCLGEFDISDAVVIQRLLSRAGVESDIRRPRWQ